MTIRYAPHLLALLLASSALIGCSSSSSDSTPITPSYTVTTSLLGGTASPANPSVKEGDSVDITLTADDGYTLDAVSGCPGTLNGIIYTTDAVTTSCTLTASFTKNAGYDPVTLGYGIKQLKFTWPAVSGASYYQLQEQATSGAPFLPVGAQLTELNAARDIPVHLHDWVNASYIVTAYNDSGESIDSNVVTTTLTDAVNAIGYVKADIPSEGDFFGSPLALSGDGRTLVVGVYNDDGDGLTNSGAVYVFGRDAAGTWTQQALLRPVSGGVNDQFGVAVALSDDGNTLAVGASDEDSGDATDPTNGESIDSGAVYVYTRANGSETWNGPAYIKAAPIAAGAYFGASLALNSDGSTLAAGALEVDGAGAVYTFSRDSGWTQQQRLTATNEGISDWFWISLALSDDGSTMAVGSMYEDSNFSGVCVPTDPACQTAQTDDTLNSDSGAVYVFAYSGSAWEPQAYIKSANTQDNGHFGYSSALSTDGNRLVVGAPGEGANTGAVYAYARDSSGLWSELPAPQPATAGIPEARDEFGRIVALSDDGKTLAVGAPKEDSSATAIDGAAIDGGETEAGAVYVFGWGEASWSQLSYVKASNTQTNDGFGGWVALSGDGGTLAVGAPGEQSAVGGVCATVACNGAQDPNALTDLTNAGAVYLY